MHPDDALANLQALEEDFKDYLLFKAHVSETDTRIKLVDRMLKDVLGWPESVISREDHTKGAREGYSDYRLHIKNIPYIVVEAKREGVVFELPKVTRRKLKISGALQSSTELIKAIEQVRQYCVDDIMMPYAIATNGYAWVLFKTSYGKTSWRDENAVIFSSIEDIKTHFIKFWNLLSYECVANNSLETEFSKVTSTDRKQYRVRSFLHNADAPLHRNILHAQLHPIIDAFFDDIADKDAIDILKSCYVHSRSIKYALLDLDNVINDKIPLFLKKEGTKQLLTGEKDSGIFDADLRTAIEKNLGSLYILLGGIGAGKTTFIKRYIRYTGHEVLEKHAAWFYIPMLGPPQNPNDLEEIIYNKLLADLRSRYHTLVLENRRTIKKIFAAELALVHESTLKPERLKDDEYEKRLSPYLDKWSQNVIDYTTRILKECSNRGKTIILFIDNVDQLPPDYQQKVFFLAQKITREVGSLTILAMREESYHSASTQKTLTAYSNKKFHIVSPRFRKLIEYRLNYAAKVLIKSDEEVKFILKSGIEIDKRTIFDFLKIIQNSIFSGSKKVSFFIDSICQGNMRQALEMFNTFLISGSTDVAKMLRIYRREIYYNVPFHEFLKSIMLGEKAFYRETDKNPVMNIYECSTTSNSSHFTSLRLLNLLESHKDEYNQEGRGFTNWANVQYEFENAFDNIDDLLFCAKRLLRWKLVEVNTKSSDSFDNVTHIKCTSAGYYYLKSLHVEFSYLDLVLQDTPIDDEETSKSITELMRQVDNLSGKEEDKYNRMLIRFNRVNEFIEYLLQQENQEQSVIKSLPINPVFLTKFVPSMIGRLNEQRVNILGKYEANLQKYSRDDNESQESYEDFFPGFLELFDSDENGDEISADHEASGGDEA